MDPRQRYKTSRSGTPRIGFGVVSSRGELFKGRKCFILYIDSALQSNYHLEQAACIQISPMPLHT